mmetsp:Transcript_2945/g.4092  ORF Transcript_2945/g.4092 Transcript_2945/m.4092 type:complete len:90 (+) Transcript_2945:24-293(+)
MLLVKKTKDGSLKQRSAVTQHNSLELYEYCESIKAIAIDEEEKEVCPVCLKVYMVNELINKLISRRTLIVEQQSGERSRNKLGKKYNRS